MAEWSMHSEATFHRKFTRARFAPRDADDILPGIKKVEIIYAKCYKGIRKLS